jgi:hypothetical protein
MSVTQIIAVGLALALYRLRRPQRKLPVWLRLRPMRGGDVVQGSIFGFVTPLGKDVARRYRRRSAVARSRARQSVNPEHRDRRL